MNDLELDLPNLPAPRCEWETLHATKPCGAPATWTITLHDFESTDRDDTRVFFMCPDCAVKVITWAKDLHDREKGVDCRGCRSHIAPMCGGVLIGYGELAYPDRDVRYV